MASDWRIPEKVARESAEDFAKGQYQAYLLGFKAAMDEAESMRELREWLETQRDESTEQYKEHDDDMHFSRQMVMKEVLVKLSEMGCHPEDADG